MRLPQACPKLDLDALIALPEATRRLVLEHATPLPYGKYLHWDELRRRPPPEGLTHEQWWQGIAFARSQVSKTLPVPRAREGDGFKYAQVDPLFEMTSEIDRRAGGQIAIAEPVVDPRTRDSYVVRSLIEEAITSSQLEGASTTKRVAKDMLRSGRKPTTKDERMILNNFTAMEMLKEFVGKRLTLDTVLTLHRVLTEGTLEDPTAAGRFRRADEAVVVTDELDQTLHVPPAADTLPLRMEKLLEFANGGGESTYMHRAVRAVTLHFWLAFDHPFVDGNGRTARALFYWSMLSQGYWLTEFLSISSILKKAQAKYAPSYLHCETSDGDATYFILYQLRVLLQSIDALDAYLTRKVKEQRASEKTIRSLRFLNHRQVALATHALKHPDFEYTIESHRRSHGVVYQTARRDLLEMERLGLLTKIKRGKAFYFHPVKDLGERIHELEPDGSRPRT